MLVEKTWKGAADTPECHAAVQRDFEKLEKCVDVNLMEVRERKCKVLKQERNNTKHLHMPEFTQLKSSFAEKDPQGVLHNGGPARTH